jgi:predicted molibdopterin-dependent oxidoreductase YjgC
MPEIRIDGASFQADEGATILEAARGAGSDVPTLCYDPRLTPGGSCRLCLVEVDGREGPVAACTFPVADGMSVTTASESLDAFRRKLLELVQSEIPVGDCRHCAEIGPCELHELAERYGASAERFRGATSGAVVDDGNPLILRDYDACIYCYRCTRICNEIEQAHAIVPGGHGFSSRISTLLERGLEETDCTFCGQCINTCPTGALADLPRVGRASADEITDSVKTVCPYCGTGCTLNLDVAGDKIVGARPDFDSPASRGALCIKGQFGWEFVHSPDRLTTPLVRRDGVLQPASWDEALGHVVDRFSAVKEQHGPDSMVFWSSARATSEANYLFQKFARAVIGTNNVDNCART